MSCTYFKLFLCLCTTVLPVRTRILRLQCKSYAEYRYVKEDHILLGAGIVRYNNMPLGECEVECVSHPECKSLNSNNDVCVLNNKTISDQTDNCTISQKNANHFKDSLMLKKLESCTLYHKHGWTFKSTDYTFPLVGPNCKNVDPCGSKEFLCVDSCQCPGYECINCTDLPDYPCPAPCDYGPCKNGARCIDKGMDKNSYECLCKPGYTGPQCEQDINECNSNPCGTNSDHCYDDINNFRCQCKDGWTGKQCETALAPSCDWIHCQYGGTCVGASGAAKCECAPGYTGDRCETFNFG